MIKDIQLVNDSYNFDKDVQLFEKLNMFYFKVLVGQNSCTLLSHKHKIISLTDRIINSMWDDIANFVDTNIDIRRNIITSLYDQVIIGFFYCPCEKPLNISYSNFLNSGIVNNTIIINNVKSYGKDIDVTEFCKNVNLLNIRGIGGGPKMFFKDEFIKYINLYAHKLINKSELIDIAREFTCSYSGNDISDIEGIIIKDNKNIYQIIFNDTNDTRVYDRSIFDNMLNDFIDIWQHIKIDNYYGASINERYLNIINDIFLQYIEKSEYIKKINDASALTPPGNHYIADLSYNLINNKSIETICKLNDVYKNVYRILFKGLNKHKKPNTDIDTDKWNKIVDNIIEMIREA